MKDLSLETRRPRFYGSDSVKWAIMEDLLVTCKGCKFETTRPLFCDSDSLKWAIMEGFKMWPIKERDLNFKQEDLFSVVWTQKWETMEDLKLWLKRTWIWNKETSFLWLGLKIGRNPTGFKKKKKNWWFLWELNYCNDMDFLIFVGWQKKKWPIFLIIFKCVTLWWAWLNGLGVFSVKVLGETKGIFGISHPSKTWTTVRKLKYLNTTHWVIFLS